jgi:hypothetical protein
VPELEDMQPPECFTPWLASQTQAQDSDPSPENQHKYPPPCVAVADTHASDQVGSGEESAGDGLFHGHAPDRVKVTNGGGDLRFLDFDQVCVQFESICKLRLKGATFPSSGNSRSYVPLLDFWQDL